MGFLCITEQLDTHLPLADRFKYIRRVLAISLRSRHLGAVVILLAGYTACGIYLLVDRLASLDRALCSTWSGCYATSQCSAEYSNLILRALCLLSEL